MGALVEGVVEFLPVKCDQQQGLTALNVTNMLDVLDEEASEVTRFRDGRLMRIRRYVFLEEPLRGVTIFKIPNFRVSPTFVGDAFVSAWRKAGLKGLVFSPIWSSPAAGRASGPNRPRIPESSRSQRPKRRGSR
jgi:hypothetical protein